MYLQLMSHRNPLVRQYPERVSPGDFALVRDKDDIANLGNIIEIRCLSVEPFARVIVGEEVLETDDPKSGLFQRAIDTSREGHGWYGGKLGIKVADCEADWFLMSNATRSLVNIFREIIDWKVLVSSELCEHRSIKWFTPRLWLPSDRVVIPPPAPERPDFDPEWFSHISHLTDEDDDV